MLEKPGSLIPYAEVITEGPKASLFSIFAVTRCQMLAFKASDLNRALKSYPSDDANIVHDAIRKEFSGEHLLTYILTYRPRRHPEGIQRRALSK